MTSHFLRSIDDTDHPSLWSQDKKVWVVFNYSFAPDGIVVACYNNEQAARNHVLGDKACRWREFDLQDFFKGVGDS